MRKIVWVFLAILLLVSSNGVFAVEADISAQAAILLDMQTGRVYYQKNADAVLPMASTTKMMSALTVLESGMDLDEVFTVDSKAIQVEGSSMGLQIGDRASLRTLCYGMLLSSGNDAANAAAVRVSGSIASFCERMNEHATKIGLQNTHFATPSGLDDTDHYTTARELGQIAVYALKNPDFRAICSQMSATVSFGNPPYERTLYNHNRLLRSYEGTIGIKTGFTKKAGRCLVSAAERNGVGLICVTLNAPDDWNDHRKLYDAAFSELAQLELQDEDVVFNLKVTGGAYNTVLLKPKTDPVATLSEGERARIKCDIILPPFAYAPVLSGEAYGEAVYSLDGNELARVELVAVHAIEKQQTHTGFFQKLWQKISEWIQ